MDAGETSQYAGDAGDDSAREVGKTEDHSNCPREARNVARAVVHPRHLTQGSNCLALWRAAFPDRRADIRGDGPVHDELHAGNDLILFFEILDVDAHRLPRPCAFFDRSARLSIDHDDGRMHHLIRGRIQMLWSTAPDVTSVLD